MTSYSWNLLRLDRVILASIIPTACQLETAFKTDHSLIMGHVFIASKSQSVHCLHDPRVGVVQNGHGSPAII